MTEDYTGIISFILTMIAGGYWIHSFFAGYNGSSSYEPITDNFKIGYIEAEPQKIVIKDHSPELLNRIKDLECLVNNLKKELHKQPQKVQKNNPVHTAARQSNKPKASEGLQEECSLALQSLGYKKREADRASKNFLEQNSVKDVQDFIVKFFKDKK